jgi:hypothetical protein
MRALALTLSVTVALILACTDDIAAPPVPSAARMSVAPDSVCVVVPDGGFRCAVARDTMHFQLDLPTVPLGAPATTALDTLTGRDG